MNIISQMTWARSITSEVESTVEGAVEEDIEAGTSKVESTVDGVSRGLAMIVIFQHVKHA